MTVGDRDDYRLHRRQPDRECPGIMLDQRAEETLHAAQQSAVHHVRSMGLSILAHISQVKALRHVEVELDGGKLPFASQGILHFQVDLWTVKCAAPVVKIVR